MNKHITRGWTLSPFLNQYVDLVPAQMRTGGAWYQGTADAVYQNIFHIHDEEPDYVCVFGGIIYTKWMCGKCSNSIKE